MAGIKFLSPPVKVVLCAVGMLVMGYVLYPSLTSGETPDSLTMGRILVFLAFAYFFARNIGTVMGRNSEAKGNDKVD